MVRPSSHKLRRSLSLHDQVLGDLAHPHWLVEGTLLDHEWTINLKDGEFADPIVVDFDQPITPWPNGRTLTHPDLENDLVTAKLVLFNALRAEPYGWIRVASSARSVLNAHLTFIRWRTDRGILRNDLLTAAWFNEFDASLKSGGLEGLLNLSTRAKIIISHIEDGQLVLPRNARGDIRSNALAKALGVSVGVQISAEARSLFEEHFKKNSSQFTRSARDRKTTPKSRKNPVASYAARYYSVWHDLHKLSEPLSHDAIGYNPFTSRIEVQRWASKYFSATEKTHDAPAEQAAYLIDASLRIVLDPLALELIKLAETGVAADGSVKDLARLDACNRELQRLGFRPLINLPPLSREVPADCVTLQQMVFRIMPLAARVIIATFSARRDKEIQYLLDDCIERDAAGDVWLRSPILKTMRRREKVPAPVSVERAVHLVKAIKKAGGAESKRLFAIRCPVIKRNVKWGAAQWDRATKFFDVPPLNNGGMWKFKPHQFRKLFGVMYFWRWAFPNLTALTLHYRHYNPDTTRGYITMRSADGLRLADAKLANVVRLENQQRLDDLLSSRREFIGWVINEVANGADLRGALGQRITEQVQSLAAEYKEQTSLTVAVEQGRTFDQALADLVSNVSLRVHPEGHSLCGSGTRLKGSHDSVGTAQCLRLRHLLTGAEHGPSSEPDFAYACAEGCLKCAFRVALPTMDTYWDEELYETVQSLVSAQPSQAVLLRERLKQISEFA